MEKVLSFDIGIVNLGWAHVKKNENSIDVLDYGIINLNDKKEKMCPAKFCEVIMEKFKAFNDINFDGVIIEHQPNFNSKMKMIETMILMYFKIKGKMVFLQNPIMKVFNHKFAKKNKYKETKKFSVFLCQHLLDENLFNQIKTFNKIDDITDAILHATSFLFKNKPPEKIAEFI